MEKKVKNKLHQGYPNSFLIRQFIESLLLRIENFHSVLKNVEEFDIFIFVPFRFSFFHQRSLSTD